MRRIFVFTIGMVMLICMSSEVRAQCAGGSCSASGGGFSLSRMFSGFGRQRSSSYSSRSMMSYSAPQMMSSYQSYSSAPMAFSSSPMMSSSCYSSSYSSPMSMTYSVPARTYSVPMMLVPAVPQSPALATPQSQSAPPLPSKSTPSADVTPSRSSRKVPPSAETRRAILKSQPKVQEADEEVERPPTARIGCFGSCCGYDADCECGEPCPCEPPPGKELTHPRNEFPAPKKARNLFAQVYDQMNSLVDYSELTNVDTSRQVDYSELSNKTRVVAKTTR